MRVLILGAGGVGGYVGGRLMESGADVAFMARGDRHVQLAAEGLRVESPLGGMNVPVETILPGCGGFAPDVVVLACKAPAIEAAIEAIGPALLPSTRILPMLNGVAHLETLRKSLPDNPLLAGLVHGALTLREEGTIAHLTPFLRIRIGSLADPSDPLALALVEHLERARVEVTGSTDIRRDLWDKFVFLCTLAGITCLMRARIGAILEADDGEALILELLDECVAVARSEGYPPDEAVLSAYRGPLMERGSTFTSSMLRDIEAGRGTEGDHVLGDMLRRARRHNIRTPLLRTATAHLQCFDRGLRRGMS
ncbi:2-dehydropantoate 2-reductase [Hyphomicrobium sp.]|uniref:ketopantoate reductase family protein n=1 Tax=Hyphomicrobium sp. TaxID=82 RepID=UPI002E30ACBE|nr:2-dehydropantoate 2-reductase [Hyphomicrobium sp.]HEX2841069.1 2-dehydropantoate 2-reductase [Hyphomicrobium sp.]